MATNSIKQKTANPFLNERARGTSFDANILCKLGNAKSTDRAAWVLVGGRSSRMGRDKALAVSAGRALALRVADAVSTVVGGNVSLVGNPEIYAELGLPVVEDRFPGQGPLAGIEAALAASSSAANLIVACDMPGIDENLLEQLFASGGDCALPRHDDGRVEPLCAVYRRGCHAVIRTALEGGVRRVTEALELLALSYVRVSDPASFANLNTPDDWQRYHHG